MKAVQQQNAPMIWISNLFGCLPKALLVEPDVLCAPMLTMLLTIIVQPFTCGCQQYAKRL